MCALENTAHFPGELEGPVAGRRCVVSLNIVGRGIDFLRIGTGCFERAGNMG